MSHYLSEAFKKLDVLNEDTFAINTNGLKDFVKFEDVDELEDSIDVIDTEAETIDDLQDSYVGKVILDCCVCHSKLYKDVEDVVIEDDIANANEECPFCYTTDGYRVIGQVASFDETEEKETEEKDETEVEEKDDKIDEGLFGIKTKKEKEKEAKAKAAKEAQKQRDKELKDQEERARQQSVADSWARSDRAKRDAQREYNRSRYNGIKGDKPSNTGYRGVNYSGGDYYSESYKDTHMIMGGDGSEIYTDEDLRKIWDNSHTSDPSMKEYKSFDDWKSDTISQMEEINESVEKRDVFCTDCDTITTQTYKGSFKDGIRTLGRYTCDKCGCENEDEPLTESKSIREDWEDEYNQALKEVGDQLDNYGEEEAAEYLYMNNHIFRHYKAKIAKELGIESEYRKWTTPESKSIKEDINNLSLDTDDTHMEMSSDENGKVTITTEPKETFVESEEVITPLEPETQSEISDNVEDGGEIEIDMDEFDEKSFDELGEGYLKKVYENVNSFKTSNVSMIKDKLVLEGVINFTSGKSKKTNFVFGIREATKSGKVRFIGENKEIARGRKSFTVTGRVDNKKFLSESLNYNYGVRGANGKAQRLYGTVRRGK